MAREYFEKYSPVDKTKALLKHIVDIIDEYDAMHLTLTLRQLYYQLVSKDLIKNEEKVYKAVGEIVSRARRAGFLDWDALEDRVRRPQRPPEYADLEQLVDAALHSYRLPRLQGQKSYVELWVEKDALAGVLSPIAYKYHVTLMVNRGYSSTSAMKDAGERLRQACVKMDVDAAHVLYLGDHDPSGEDMVRDVSDRLTEYVNEGFLLKEGTRVIKDAKGKKETVRAWVPETILEHTRRMSPLISVEVHKLALTMAQIEEHEPPPNPTKTSDSRAPGYIDKFGHESWEVDALPPAVLRDIIEAKLDELVDMKLVDKIKAQETKDKALLTKAVASLRKKK